jgi:anti-anti-sigma factor
MASPTPSGIAGGMQGARPLRLDVRRNSDGVGVAVQLFGELDVATAPWLLDRMRETLSPADRAVALELGGLTFLDVAGVRAVVALDDLVKQRGGKLELSGLEGGPLTTARILGLDMSREV